MGGVIPDFKLVGHPMPSQFALSSLQLAKRGASEISLAIHWYFLVEKIPIQIANPSSS
jgi:hypothetical protein